MQAKVLKCWGKTIRQENGHGNGSAGMFHPALYHMIDVGNIAQALLREDASRRWRNVLGGVFGMDSACVQDWLPFLIAMHDIGKFSSDFQSQVAIQKERLLGEGFVFGRPGGLHHTVIGQIYTVFDLENEVLPRGLRLVLRDASGGHHGRFIHTSTAKDQRGTLLRDEPPMWRELRRAAMEQIRDIFWRGIPEGWSEPASRSASVMALTGFTILCDWLGSDERFFGLEPDMDYEDYLAASQQRGYDAVRQAGFLQPVRSQASEQFQALFPNLQKVRPLQSAVDGIPERILASPFLAIIEAPTGEGKTEAALALSHRAARAQGSEELYYALPTTATSNQMFARVQRYLIERLGLRAQVKLVHSQAFLQQDDQQVEPLGSAMEQDMLEWFSPKKRALIAPFGVGTIDQAELCALNTKHNALRMIGLAGKVLILDEVHAYDTYMTTIIARLLEWLSAMGTTVILLSATLPHQRRKQLLQAYSGKEEVGLEQPGAYPSMILCGKDEIHQQNPPAAQEERILEVWALGMQSDDPDSRAAWLLNQVRSGGCACWISNTVDRAQQIFEALERHVEPEVERLLIHSRFSVIERERLEDELQRRYGPSGERPRRGIVIGTQVLEQSLDLDFDVMVSDLAPVDLLLQRAGRLHRHARVRPDQHDAPRLYISLRQGDDGALDLRGDLSIYPEFILRKTWQVINWRSIIRLPQDYRTLIEAVYDAGGPPEGDPLEPAWKEMRNSVQADGARAAARLLPVPDPEESFCGRIGQVTFEENEDSAGWLVAQTRLGERSLTVVPLERRGNLAACAGMTELLDPDSPLPRQVQLEVLRHSLRISHRGVVEGLEAGSTGLKMFTGSALLTNVTPLWMENGRADVNTRSGKYVLLLDKRLGLVIRREGKEG